MEFPGNNTTLAEFIVYERSYRIPAFIFLGFLTVIGLIGNLLVLHIYGCRIKKKKVQHFITLLAVYDTLCCLLGLPLKMLDLWMSASYPTSGLCKLQNSVICFVCVASALTLLVIAIDRYKKVCRPTKAQLSLIHVKISFVVITLISLVFAGTAAFIYDRFSKTLASNSEVVYHVCLMEFESVVTQIYFMALVAVLITVLVSLLVLYCLVWRTAMKHSADSLVVQYRVPTNSCASQKSHSKKPVKTNTTRILVLISLLFFISFVPSLIAVIIQNILGKNSSYTTKAVTEFIFAMWGLNSTMNPIIYGFCNRNFILHIRNLFSRVGILKKHQRSVTSGDTSGT